MTPISYTLLPEDVLAAGRFCFMRTYRKNIVRNAIIIVAIAGVITGSIAFFDGFDLKAFAQSFAVLVSIYTGLLIILIPIMWFVITPLKTKKTFKQMPAISREQTLSWDDTTLSISSSQGEMRAPFLEFHQYCGNSDHIIIYPADYVFYPFPRRIFPKQQDFDELAALLNSSGVKRI
jgi:hypothetical protein